MSVSEIRPIAIEDELKHSYLDYAMSVIVSRALPDVRDGLKPVHRRVLFAMHELGNDYNKAYKKSARVVGDVIGKYHPHGDYAVYETIVRMAQDFSLRYQLVDGQGNFGSIDGDSAAAMRYTEVRMRKLTHELLADLEKDTVDWEDNYDGSERIPQVMPTRIPNLLVNGAAGIAVGMATNMAPHNMTEVVHACLAYADNPNISIEGLMEHITGPDFPTGGIIYGKSGIVDAYRTGKGRLHIRGKYHFEEDQKSGRTTIVFTEIPYQVNKAKTIERIAELVKEKKLEGISELRDESDKEGMRIAIDLKRGENAEVIVNNLFLNTQLENSFSINMVCLDNGQPKLMNLKDIIAAFIRHRQEVVTRRTMFELRKARERGHILEGLTVALANIDAIIETIKSSANPAEARERLQVGEWAAGGVVALLEKAGSVSIRPDEIEGEDLSRPFGLGGDVYRLSPAQVGAILELRLHRLTGLEQDKLHAEYSEILAQIAEYTAILNDFNLLMAVIREELALVLQQYGDARRTEIVESRIDFSREDLIPEEQVVLTVSQSGYAKTQPLSDYQAQRRGGRGKSATSMKEDDYIQHLIVTSNHATVLCFTDVGKVYRLKVFEVPQASRGSKGRPMVNLLPLDANETITAILPVIDAPKKFKERLADFRSFVKANAAHLQTNAIIAAHYAELEAAFAELADGDDLSDALRVQLKQLGVELSATDLDDEIIAEFASQAEALRKNFYVFMATASGTVKRVELEQFSNVRSNGLRAIELNEDDTLIGVAITDGEQQIMLFSNEGKAIRFAETDVRSMGRAAKGVRGMRVSFGSAQVEDVEDAEVDSDDEDNSDSALISRIVSLVVVPETGEVLCASANGYGKRTPVDDFPTKKRGGKGVIAIKTSERNGELVGAVAIDESKELMLISDGGTLVRTRASEVAQTGRNAQGVRLIRLGENETLVGVEAIEAVEEEDDLLDEALNAESSETPAAADVQAEDAPVENNLTEAALDDQNSTD
ncbi:DNA gyrase subunit A [Acinetobacter sp. KAM398]|uniref:DNA gyrase subunit A n=1 Tax=unclassified Acinetobacter TaxID=196816 RepID=UPI001F433C25|nr:MULTISPECIES: DNA gyrase subunit A [unclassified Acinetobacter]GJC30092.1 DNA gyrase subunit A [Acinetobacter sp. KAM392]GJC32902.1 DNA gyrase subunit A [Acinetobacter sp. KAM393]GJC35731.1 DNA gyrase subunit A [Acinetobacter sp. KAM394]GJC38694.1 DNA gyrase subunit A [Acinetobacter sp. KAM395]GJC41519.1 DNA gyrase subunit A [Acinetobacter sp. KAM396]